MARRSEHWHILQAAKQEALLAVDFFNRRRGDRCLESFIVHMSIAWLYLCHSILRRAKTDIRYHADNGRLVKIDGQPKLWELAKCIAYLLPENSAIRKNVEFFLGLRNIIEHRFKRDEINDLEPVIAGKAQAFVLNFEDSLVREFGRNESLGAALRFPIFLSTFTDDAVVALKRTYARLHGSIRSYIETYEVGLPQDIHASPQYEFRVYMLQKVSGSKAADLAVEFLHREKLTDEQKGKLDDAIVMIKERTVEVANIDKLKPSAVVEAVRKKYPWFTQHLHQLMYRHFKVRPPGNASNPKLTDAKYCIYDAMHCDYGYTPAWVEKVVRELDKGPTNYEQIVGKPPKAGLYAKAGA